MSLNNGGRVKVLTGPRAEWSLVATCAKKGNKTKRRNNWVLVLLLARCIATLQVWRVVCFQNAQVYYDKRWWTWGPPGLWRREQADREESGANRWHLEGFSEVAPRRGQLWHQLCHIIMLLLQAGHHLSEWPVGLRHWTGAKPTAFWPTWGLVSMDLTSVSTFGATSSLRSMLTMTIVQPSKTLRQPPTSAMPPSTRSFMVT